MKTEGTARISLDRLRQLEEKEEQLKNLIEDKQLSYSVNTSLGWYRLRLIGNITDEVKIITNTLELAFKDENEYLKKENKELKQQLKQQLNAKKSWWKW